MNAAEGDFRLRETSVQAFRKGIPLVEVETDFFGTQVETYCFVLPDP